MKTVRSTVAAASLATVLATALTGCGQQDDVLVSTSAPRAGSASASSTGSDVTAETANAVERLATTDYPARYAGLEIADDVLVVYRTAGAPDMDEALQTAAGPTTVTFRDARYSAENLAPLRARIEADFGFWAERGITVTTVSVPPDGSGVEVGVSEIGSAREQFLTRYGAEEPLVLHKENPSALTG